MVSCIPIHNIKDGKIDGKKIDDFIDGIDKDIVYLLDVNSHMRKEMNLKVYEDLSGILELWIDAAPKRLYDVMDILVIGGNKVVINPFFIKWKEIAKSLEVTENIILKSYKNSEIERFIDYGGKEILTSSKIAPSLNTKTYIIKGGEICPWRN